MRGIFPTKPSFIGFLFLFCDNTGEEFYFVTVLGRGDDRTFGSPALKTLASCSSNLSHLAHVAVFLDVSSGREVAHFKTSLTYFSLQVLESLRASNCTFFPFHI
jgi:hypothetical protein